MAATAIDSVLLGDLFSTPAMRALFSDRARLQRYLDIEAALARVEAELGLIPEAAAAEIVRHCQADGFDMERLARDTLRAGSPILPVVRQLVERCADGLGEYAHWGATTQDIADTAMVLQLRDALGLIEADLRGLVAGLARLARAHRDTAMAGRTNTQHATPVTFGYRCAVLLAGFERHLARLAQLRTRVLVGQFAGATGTLAALGADGLRVQAALCRALGLGEPEIAWHTMRDNVAELGCFLGLLTGTLGKFALDVRLLTQTEIGEVAEPYLPGRGGSSTMPQKRNPVAAAYMDACAAMARQHVAALLEAMVQDHERAAGPWQIEWMAVPELCCLAAGALAHGRALAEGLVVDPSRMRANLDLTGGLVVSEAVMMGLAPHLGRHRAHEVVQEVCEAVLAGHGTLLDLLAAHPAVVPHADRAALAVMLDPAGYTGLAGEMVDRVLARCSHDCA